jgi:hypothetical protein
MIKLVEAVNAGLFRFSEFPIKRVWQLGFRGTYVGFENANTLIGSHHPELLHAPPVPYHSKLG